MRQASERSDQAIGHVLWDWNGTLLDDVSHCIFVMNEMLLDAGLVPLSFERYRKVFDFPVKSYYERLGFDLAGDRWEQLAARFIERYDAGVGRCALYPGVAGLLRALAGAGVHNVVLSAARRDSIELLADSLGIRGYLHDVLGLSDHYAHGKVDLGVGWLARTNANVSDTIFVGDTVHDHEVAEAMGVECVLIDGGHQSRERLEATGRRVVASVRELSKVLVGGSPRALAT